MKRLTELRYAYLGFVALLALPLLLAACGGSGSSSAGSSSTEAGTEKAATPEETPSIAYDGPEKGLPMEYAEPAKTGAAGCKIGYMNIYGAIPSLAEQQKAAEEEAENLGCALVTLDDQLNPTTQVNNFSQLLSQKTSGIIVYPIVPEALAPSVKQANAAKIQVIADATPPAATEPLPSGYETRVLQGNDRVSYLRAKFIAEEDPHGEFVILGLAVPISSLQYLGERTKYWAEKFGLEYAGEIDAQEDTPGGAATAMSGILGKYPNVKAVFAYNDNAAVAASTVAKSSQREVSICGSNGQKEAFQAIESGAMACTVRIDYHAIGRQLVRGAYDAVTNQGGKLPETVVPPVELVDQDNVASVEPIG